MANSLDMSSTYVTGVEEIASVLQCSRAISGCTTTQMQRILCICFTKSVPVLEDEFRCVLKQKNIDSNFGAEL